MSVGTAGAIGGPFVNDVEILFVSCTNGTTVDSGLMYPPSLSRPPEFQRHIQTFVTAIGTSSLSSPGTPAFNFVSDTFGSVFGHGTTGLGLWRRMHSYKGLPRGGQPTEALTGRGFDPVAGVVVGVAWFPLPLEQPATSSAAPTRHAPNTRPFATILSSMTLSGPGRFLGRVRRQTA